jgi:integrase
MNDLIRLDNHLLVDQAPVAAGTYLAKLAKGSRRTMEQALRTMAGDFSGGRFGAQDFPWEKLRYEHTQAIRAKLVERYAPATVNKMLSALRGVLKECWRLGKLDVEALHRACDIAPVKGNRVPKGRALTRAEQQLLLLRLFGRDRTLVHLLLVTGLRRAEACSVTWNDYTGQALRVTGKGNKQRVVPLPHWVCRDLRMPAVATGANRIFPISPSRVWAILREASFEAGIAPVSPHDLRRTYATRLLDAGVDLAMVQRLMGHASPTTTSGYDRRGLNEAAVAVNRVFG